MNRFVAALGEELSLTSEEIADILWLAVQMGELPQPAASDAIEGSDTAKSHSPQRNDPLPKKNLIEPQIPDTSPPPAEIHLADDHSSFGGGLAISVPDARSLREPLELARSLKPLLQRVASGWSNVLDEEATILKIDREQIWMPVLKPNLEAWLDLVLVVDESISMQIWQRTISELQRFLAHYGVFRDVRVYSLVVESDSPEATLREGVYVRPRLGAASEGQSLRNPKELIDPSGRRLILVATDCVSTFWRSGEVLPALKLWAKSGPMAIVQMLPEWLWGRSGLGLASAVRFGSLQAGIPNHQLKATNLSLWDDVDLDLGIKVPVVTLEPEMMKTWAQLVAGKGGMQSPGFVFDPEPMPSIGEERSQVEFVSAGSGEERVRRFQVTASPMARQLAMILAAAPTISLPIVRILQERLLPRSQQVHVAEVFLGGLLKPLLEVDAQSNPDLVPYEFMDGARDVLLDSVPTTEVVNVMQEVSQFVAERLGLTLDAFMGVLRNPEGAVDRDVVSKSRPFAMMTAQILRKLGGGYAQLAQELEQAHRRDTNEFNGEVKSSYWNIPPQFLSLMVDKTEGFVGREYVFDAIQSFIDNNPMGYFTIIGDHGMGKSAILAKYSQDTGCIAHFNVQLQGLNRADQFLESVCKQLIDRYQLPYDSLPTNATQDGEFLGQLLDEAAQNRNGQPVIIAVDALDEVDEASYKYPNILYLPPHLPEGVYFILSRQRGVEVPLKTYTPNQIINLLDYQIDSQRDVRSFIQNKVNGSEKLRQQIDQQGETTIVFTDKIAAKSENNFMYLRYVLQDIESGAYKDLSLESFPQGLGDYYNFHWHRMGMDIDPLPIEKIKIAYVLSEVREPISRQQICDFTGEDIHVVKAVLNEWQQFLHEFVKEKAKCYGVYHSSFRDFLHRQDILDRSRTTIPGIHLLIAKEQLNKWKNRPLLEDV
jgi:hypothetical protein